MKNLLVRLGPKAPRYYVQIMAFILIVTYMITPALAVEDMWTAANRIIVDVYNKIAGISTVLAGLMSAVAVIGAKVSNNQHKTDQAWDWLKRIWIAWAIINGMGAFLAYVRPLFDSLATIQYTSQPYAGWEVVFILEGIFKGFVQWVYSLCLEMVQYIANSLLEVFQMDLSYFRQVAPVTDDILSIVIAVGWALLLGNLVFQAMKSMVIGLGFEGEDPKLLFTRTFVFAFLLLVSQQICEIGLGISSQVIALLQVPTSVTITIPDENNFTIGASWLLIIIVGIVVMWQFVKLCFEVAERYVVTAILVLMAPLAFGMGGSKNTEDIFKGWCRMFGSMCVMMIMNVIFLKLLISALGYVPSGVAVLPWMLLIVGIARVARKIDGIIARMGLNPALTGDGLGRGLPGMVAYAVVKGIGSSIAKAAVGVQYILDR